jgi:hypothetical protein
MYSLMGTDSIVISHTGLEDVSLVDSEINRVYSIDTITTATIINDRLAAEHLLLSVNQIYQLWRMLR